MFHLLSVDGILKLFTFRLYLLKYVHIPLISDYFFNVTRTGMKEIMVFSFGFDLWYMIYIVKMYVYYEVNYIYLFQTKRRRSPAIKIKLVRRYNGYIKNKWSFYIIIYHFKLDYTKSHCTC